RRRVRYAPGALADDRLAAARELGDRDTAARRALDARLAVRELQVAGVDLELLGGELEQLPPNLDGRLDDGAPVVERRLRPRRAAVPRRGIGVLVEQREVVRAHAERARDEQRQPH